MNKMPLDGVRIIDFGRSAAGPLISKPLADFGARVIRVESAISLDIFRTFMFKDGIADADHGGGFAYLNANKRSVSIDMTDPRGLELVRRLVAWADVVLDNFTPGVMKRFGLDYESLKVIKPDIIALSSSVQGQTGPHAKMPAYGSHLTSLSGFCYLTGWPDREPVLPTTAYTDFVSPSFATAAILAALDYRRRTGKGQFFDVSQFEACTQFLAPLFLDWSINHRDSERAGNSCAFAAPHGAYRCRGKDRWCTIAVFTDSQWQALCEVSGHSEWASDKRFGTLVARKENEDELNKIVDEWTTNFRAEEVMALLQDAGVPAGVVKSPEDIYNDPQLKHRECFWMLSHPVMGCFPHLGASCLLSETPAKARKPSPCLGEDNEMVFTEMLGLSDDKFGELMAGGVFK